MAYTTINKSTDYFNTKLWTGNATNSTAITGVGFQPDFVWIKNRSTTANHNLFDAIRGATYRVYSDDTSAQVQATDSLASFNSDGFTLNDGSPCNGSGNSVVGWNWKANGQGSSNTDGSINTTYTSANTTAGFSICQWTGTGSNATIGHGLGATPKCFIMKKTSGTSAWSMYHESIGNTKFMTMNATSDPTTSSTVFNNTSPTSSVFSVGTADNGNASGATYIGYFFAEKKGYSKFGSFTGNGNADGTFIYTGFKPAFFLFKKSSASGNDWGMFDNKRSTFNEVDKGLKPNDSGAEYTANDCDFLSNGVKMRSTGGDNNGSGATYIYMAFAEAPFVGSNNIPATAR